MKTITSPFAWPLTVTATTVCTASGGAAAAAPRCHKRDAHSSRRNGRYDAMPPRLLAHRRTHRQAARQLELVSLDADIEPRQLGADLSGQGRAVNAGRAGQQVPAGNLLGEGLARFQAHRLDDEVGVAGVAHLHADAALGQLDRLDLAARLFLERLDEDGYAEAHRHRNLRALRLALARFGNLFDEPPVGFLQPGRRQAQAHPQQPLLLRLHRHDAGIVDQVLAVLVAVLGLLVLAPGVGL